uniref:TerB N-terminal domain-containing protein n=1 Tax=Lachnoanaerobaculum gingivalis TaxID=2490855 RepID=UPI0028D4DB7B
MELKELLDYIKEKHNIEEHDRWDSFLTMSRLYHPLTGKMMALLIKEWNSNTGRWAEHCDLKYDASLFDRMKEYIVAPLRMHGSSWVGISFNDKTDRDHIFELFDKAVLQGNPSKDTALSDNGKSNTVYTDTPLPFAKGSDFLKKKEYIPEKITEMRKLYRYDDYSGQLSAKNFYRQAKFMEDYEDDYHGQVCDISGYFTTYHDLSDKQLRAYFTWRTEVRNGVYNKTFTSFIYLYIYELLCGIGSSSPVDSLNKLKEFEEKFIEGGFLEDSTQIKRNLHRWYLEYSLVKGFSVDEVKKYIEKDVLDRDHALEILKKSGNYNDIEIFESISFFAGKRFLNSVSLKKEREKSIIIPRLFIVNSMKVAESHIIT